VSLPPALSAALASAVGAAPVTAHPLGGGSINRAARVVLEGGREIFVKHHPDAPVGAFTAEAHGLGWLAEAGALRTPAVLGVGDRPGARFLALEWIAPADPGAQLGAGSSLNWASAAERFGRGLARLHRFGAPCFGLDRDNLIGPLPQDNAPRPTWAEFYGERRIVPMARRAIDAGRLDRALAPRVDALAGRLPELCGPAEPPARLHGDLWSGNALLDVAGGPVVVDPAAHGGHREVDLAMMRLFGGFPEAVFAAYAEEYPPAPGHADRLELWQLYPLLVHVVLFGGAYAAAAARVIRRHSGPPSPGGGAGATAPS
jgi:fructosamine-3-kinase